MTTPNTAEIREASRKLSAADHAGTIHSFYPFWDILRDAPDHAALRSLLEEPHRHTQRWLARPAAELGRVFGWAGDGGAERMATLHWILDGLQEHDIHHRAQLNTYLRLMGITPPSM